MDIWILTRETGSYSYYNMHVLAVASSIKSAHALADEHHRREYIETVETTKRHRCDWPAERERLRCKWEHDLYRDLDWDRTYVSQSAEEAYPILPLCPLSWRHDDGTMTAKIADDDVWTIRCIPLDKLAEE